MGLLLYEMSDVTAHRGSSAKVLDNDPCWLTFGGWLREGSRFW